MIHDVKSFEVVDKDFLCHSEVDVKYDGTLVVMPLIDYKTLVKKYESATKDLEQKGYVLDKKLKDYKEAVETAKDLCFYTTCSWLEEHKGAKKGCGRLADAMILADAVRGSSIDELQRRRYPYKKNGATKCYHKDKIFSALSVKKPEDVNRINSLLIDYPDAFEGLTIEDVFSWMAKRSKRGQKGDKGANKS